MARQASWATHKLLKVFVLITTCDSQAIFPVIFSAILRTPLHCITMKSRLQIIRGKARYHGSESFASHKAPRKTWRTKEKTTRSCLIFLPDNIGPILLTKMTFPSLRWWNGMIWSPNLHLTKSTGFSQLKNSWQKVRSARFWFQPRCLLRVLQFVLLAARWNRSRCTKWEKFSNNEFLSNSPKVCSLKVSKMFTRFALNYLFVGRCRLKFFSK